MEITNFYAIKVEIFLHLNKLHKHNLNFPMTQKSSVKELSNKLEKKL
jgi:hypothetical protein